MSNPYQPNPWGNGQNNSQDPYSQQPGQAASAPGPYGSEQGPYDGQSWQPQAASAPGPYASAPGPYGSAPGPYGPGPGPYGSGAGQFGPGQAGAPMPGQGMPAAQQAPKLPGSPNLGPLYVRDIVLMGAALFSLIALAVPFFRYTGYYGLGYADWVWGWTSSQLTMIVAGILPVVLAAVLTLLNKTVKSFPSHIGSLSADQLISVLTAVAFTVNVLMLITTVPYYHVGGFLAFFGALIAFFAGVFTMIPFFAQEFMHREDSPAHPKARPVNRSFTGAQNAGGPSAPVPPYAQGAAPMGAPGASGPEMAASSPNAYAAPAEAVSAPGAYGAPFDHQGEQSGYAAPQQDVASQQDGAQGYAGQSGEQFPPAQQDAFQTADTSYTPADSTEARDFATGAGASDPSPWGQPQAAAEHESAAHEAAGVEAADASSSDADTPAGEGSSATAGWASAGGLAAAGAAGAAAVHSAARDSERQEASTDSAADDISADDSAPTVADAGESQNMSEPLGWADAHEQADAHKAAAPHGQAGAADSSAPAQQGAPQSGSADAQSPADPASSEVRADGGAQEFGGDTHAPSASQQTVTGENPGQHDDNEPTQYFPAFDYSTQGFQPAEKAVGAAGGERHTGTQPEHVDQAYDNGETQVFNPWSKGQGQPDRQEQGRAANSQGGAQNAEGWQHSATPQPEQQYPVEQMFWFAVPEPRPAVDMQTGQPLFMVTPGEWFLALADHGNAFIVRNGDGREGVLHNVTGIQRG